MIRLYSGSGSQDIHLGVRALSEEQWRKLRMLACDLLRKRGRATAAKALEALPFVLHEATNGFGDDFTVLYWSAPTDKYIEAGNWVDDPKRRAAFEQVAEAVSEAASTYVRFVVADLDREQDLAPVGTPNLAITSDVVDRALKDAEHLLATTGATSGIDRVHTAFHGYLKVVCGRSGISYADDASLTKLFKLVREHHPAFTSGSAGDEAGRVLTSFASAVDAINTIRNQNSVAHPNATLLGGPEAMLVINAVRTLLHYVDAKVR